MADLSQLSDAELIALAQKAGATNPAEGYTGGEQFFAGMGKGMTDVGRGIAQLTPWGPGREEIDAIRRRDAPLLQSAAGKAGNIAGGMATFAPAMAVPGINTIAGSTLAGAMMGAAAPVGTEDSRLANTAIGSAIGGITPLAVKGIGAAGNAFSSLGGGIRNLADMVLPGGPERILSRYQGKISGSQNTQLLAKALREAPELVSGSKPTAAEVISSIPEASPLVAHQKITASIPGGISAQFGQRKLDQEEARKAAELLRDTITKPMREGALSQANVMGVKPDQVLARINEIANKPGASSLAKATMNSIKEDITARTPESGIIDARDLYTIRKEIGNVIEKHAKESATWDKRLASGIEKDVQKAIDDAIEGASGGWWSEWRDYLSEFSKRSQAIADDRLRSKMAVKPPQATNLQGGINIGEETRLHAPQLLSRPMMMANFILRKLGAGIEPKIDAAAASRYLNPQELASALEKISPPSSKTMAELLRRYQVPMTSGAIQEGIQ